MAVVTIEGSTTPCVELARGQRRTVEVTDHVRLLVAKGYVIVVEGSLDEPPFATGGVISGNPFPEDSVMADLGDCVPKVGVEVPLGETAELVGDGTGETLPDALESAYPPDATPLDPPEPPPGNASREVWAAFLRARRVDFPDGDESKGEAWAGRDDLRIIWQQVSGGS